MRILLDECLPRPLRKELPGHDVCTVHQMGWAGKKNGELLRLMVPAGFGAFVTADQNLPFQQNIRTAGLVVIVLSAPTNRLVDLTPLMPQVNAALTTAQAGDLVEIRT